MSAIRKKPKYAKHIFKQSFNIESISFMANGYMWICDKNNIHGYNEQPTMTVSYILYPRQNNTLQLRLAYAGNFHREKLSYYVKEPNLWRERVWVIIPVEIISQFVSFLERNPQKLHSWM